MKRFDILMHLEDGTHELAGILGLGEPAANGRYRAEFRWILRDVVNGLSKFGEFSEQAGVPDANVSEIMKDLVVRGGRIAVTRV